MKISHSLRCLLIGGLSILALLPLRADDNTTATAKLSAPGKPATLRVDMPWADIHIKGVDGDTVTVESSLSPKGKDNRGDGLRRLDDEVSFELIEQDNVVTLSIAGGNRWGSHDANFQISVPRTIALDIKTETGGDLEVENVTGDIEITNMNGEVRLDGIVGSAVVSTMNGEVHVIYAQVPQKLVSITSMNGEIDLRVPVETKANVRLRTHNGSILTDFDDKQLKTKSEGKSFNSSDASRIGADAARAAADAARAAVDAAQGFAQEFKREIERIGEQEGGADGALSTPDVPRAPRAPRAPRPPMPPITGGKLVSGTLNGGGNVDIKISTMNGEIKLRQTEARSGSAKSTNTTSSDKPTEKVRVIFQDEDKFTDVSERFTTIASTAYLKELREYVQKTAAPLIASDHNLVITFLDIDLAGDIRPDKNDVRFMTATTLPRAHLKFQLLSADGKVVKEGERKLSDLNYQQSIRFPGQDEPLFYDKQLLKDWLNREFKKSK